MRYAREQPLNGQRLCLEVGQLQLANRQQHRRPRREIEIQSTEPEFRHVAFGPSLDRGTERPRRDILNCVVVDVASRVCRGIRRVTEGRERKLHSCQERQSRLRALGRGQIRARDDRLDRHQTPFHLRAFGRREHQFGWQAQSGFLTRPVRLADRVCEPLIIRPETLVRWHRAGFRRYWRWQSRRRGGRPPIEAKLRALIRQMSTENLLWGAPRIHGELLKLGFEVAQSSVAKYMVKRRGLPSQGWRTFLRNHAPDIAAMDLFVVPTIGFNLLYGFVIVRLDRRDLVWINVTANPTAEWIAHQITEAFPWDGAPRYMIRDRDRIYGTVVLRRLRAMGIRDKPIGPASPWQNGFAKRLIGSIRRECLDHIIVSGEAHLRRILRSYADYYNRVRTHRSLNKDAPVFRPVQRSGSIKPFPILDGLHHHYVRV